MVHQTGDSATIYEVAANWQTVTVEMCERVLDTFQVIVDRFMMIMHDICHRFLHMFRCYSKPVYATKPLWSLVDILKTDDEHALASVFMEVCIVVREIYLSGRALVSDDVYQPVIAAECVVA